MRFPPPDFQTTYKLPDIYNPNTAMTNGTADAIILFLALSATTWMVFKARSAARVVHPEHFFAGLLWILPHRLHLPRGLDTECHGRDSDSRCGRVDCGVVVLCDAALFSPFFGRVFCASVCPLGVMQELVAIAPIRIPPALDRTLGLGRYLYLGLAVLGVATGAGFFIRRWDPLLAFIDWVIATECFWRAR